MRRRLNQNPWISAALLLSVMLGLLLAVGMHGSLELAIAAERADAATSVERFGVPAGGELLRKRGFEILYDGRLRGPRLVVEVLTRQNLRKTADRDSGFNFKDEPAVAAEFRAHASDYAGSGFDIGHNAPAANHQASAAALADTFFLSNASPMRPAFNRVYWARLEGLARELANDSDVAAVWVATGPLWIPAPDDPDELVVRYVGKSKIPVASHFFKSLLIVHKNGTIEPRAWLVPHADDPPPLDSLRTSIDEIERWAGLDLWPKLPEEMEANP